MIWTHVDMECGRVQVGAYDFTRCRHSSSSIPLGSIGVSHAIVYLLPTSSSPSGMTTLNGFLNSMTMTIYQIVCSQWNLPCLSISTCEPGGFPIVDFKFPMLFHFHGYCGRRSQRPGDSQARSLQFTQLTYHFLLVLGFMPRNQWNLNNNRYHHPVLLGNISHDHPQPSKSAWLW